MGSCNICQKNSADISAGLGLCLTCIRKKPRRAQELALQVHGRIRRRWGLPERAPADKGGLACNLCVNRCRIGEGRLGYCGLRRNLSGRLEGVTASRGKLTWYHDPLPTNCVANWICPGGSRCGYPAFSYSKGPEKGYQNLAVFPHACTFHCLYCQNWHFRHHTLEEEVVSVDSLTAAVTPKTACICYFGGDPSPQLPYLLRACHRARREHPDRILRICWETNGAMSAGLLKPVARSALASGGCIKIDLKAWDETLHLALTGVTNRTTLNNLASLAGLMPEREEPPLLIASTLLVPGYIDAEEVESIADYIHTLNPDIPYALLAFHPDYCMTDLAPTSRRQAEACLAAAKAAGLTRVRLGNRHLLW